MRSAEILDLHRALTSEIDFYHAALPCRTGLALDERLAPLRMERASLSVQLMRHRDRRSARMGCDTAIQSSPQGPSIVSYHW